MSVSMEICKCICQSHCSRICFKSITINAPWFETSNENERNGFSWTWVYDSLKWNHTIYSRANEETMWTNTQDLLICIELQWNEHFSSQYFTKYKLQIKMKLSRICNTILCTFFFSKYTQQHQEYSPKLYWCYFFHMPTRKFSTVFINVS